MVVDEGIDAFSNQFRKNKRNFRVAWRFAKRGMDDCSSMCLLGPIVCCLRFKLLASNLNKVEIGYSLSIRLANDSG